MQANGSVPAETAYTPDLTFTFVKFISETPSLSEEDQLAVTARAEKELPIE